MHTPLIYIYELHPAKKNHVFYGFCGKLAAHENPTEHGKEQVNITGCTL